MTLNDGMPQHEAGHAAAAGNGRVVRVVAGAALVVALGAYLAFGVLGVGRADASGVDLNFLVVAGQTWNAGRDAYFPADRLATVGAQQAQAIYTFAYPPFVHPIAALFGAAGMPTAVYLSYVVNASALVFVIASVLRMARDATPLHERPSLQRLLWAAALVVVMPFAAHVSWMGQTSLLSLAATVAAWQVTRSGSALAGGLLLVVAAIKPQILLLPWIAMLLFLPRRASLWGALVGIAACLYPVLQAGGPASLAARWLSEAAAYRASPLNSPGFQHQTGLESLFAALGTHLPGWLFPVIGVALMVAAGLRWRLRGAEALSVACCLAVLTLPLHDYDLVILAVPIVTLCVLLSGTMPFALFGATLVMLYLPQRLLRGDIAPALLHYRTLLPAVLLVLLVRCVVQSRARRAVPRVAGAARVPEAASE
jgi:Glycosyltransferase family 87